MNDRLVSYVKHDALPKHGSTRTAATSEFAVFFFSTALHSGRMATSADSEEADAIDLQIRSISTILSLVHPQAFRSLFVLPAATGSPVSTLDRLALLFVDGALSDVAAVAVVLTPDVIDIVVCAEVASPLVKDTMKTRCVARHALDSMPTRLCSAQQDTTIEDPPMNAWKERVINKYNILRYHIHMDHSRLLQRPSFPEATCRTTAVVDRAR